MYIYIFLGIIVNCIWGLAFLVPYYLQEIDPFLLVLCRYFFYGIVSLILLSLYGHWGSLNKLDWQKAMLFALTGNIGYYFATTLSIHYAGITFPALIIGALPISMMIYSNLRNKEFAFSQLLLPIILMITGIIGIKWFQYSGNTFHKSWQYTLIGSFWGIIALLLWTWFGVANAEYLKKNFRISGFTWTLAIGVCNLLQVSILFPFAVIFNKETVMSTLQNGTLFWHLILGGIVLGVIVSWLATMWWNNVSRHLPTMLAAQLLVFETISSLSYGYILDRTWPQPMILICIAIVLTGIILGIRRTI